MGFDRLNLEVKFMEYSNNTELVFNGYKKQYIKSNHSKMAENTSSILTDDGRYLILKYWGDEYMVNNLNGNISLKHDFEKQIPVTDKIIMMSHLLDCKDGAGVSNNFVPYRKIKKAAHFKKTFIKRAIKPMNDAFHLKIEAFKKAANALGGIECSYGDYSTLLKAFPNIDLIYVYWQGDEELPTEINVLFDQNVNDFIHEECIPVVGIIGALKLIEMAV